MTISKFYETDVKNIANKRSAKLIIKSMLVNKSIQFPAFLTSFSQTFTSNWNEEEVYGRMDPIATFQNTRRSISVSFDLPAANFNVAQDNLEKCDMLAKFLYPGYKKQTEIGPATKKEKEKAEDSSISELGNVISRPPLVGVKFANLIGGGMASQLGYLSGLEWTPVLEMGMFTGTNKFFPKVISLSFTLNVLHQADKGWDESGEWIKKSPPFFSL